MKRVFSILLCAALAVSLFAIPAFADEGEVVSKIGLSEVKNNGSNMKNVSIATDTITGQMQGNKQEIKIKYDIANVDAYSDIGYIGFYANFSVVPKYIRIYPYSLIKDANGSEQYARPGVAGIPGISGMKANEWFWCYVPLTTFKGITGKVNGQDTDYSLKTLCQLIIQPEMTTVPTADSPVDVQIKDLGFYVLKNNIDGVEKEGYWNPLNKGVTTTDNVVRTNLGYGNTSMAYNDKDYLSAGYDAHDGYLTFKPNAANTNGMSINFAYSGNSGNGLTLPVFTNQAADSKGNIYRDYTGWYLSVKLRSSIIPSDLYIGAKSGYSASAQKGNDVGGIRKINSLSGWTAGEWCVLNIPMSDFMKAAIAKSTNPSTIGSINMFFINMDGTTALSDIDIADIAIYGPKRGLTVTGLKVTKSGAETATYSASDALVIAADAANTSASSKTFKAVGAFYDGETLSQVTLLDMSAAAATSATVKSEAITAPEGTTSFKAFAFTSMSDITPLCEAAQATAE